jgi:AraC-like DNA-binding protein/ligand-binding sensor protein
MNSAPGSELLPSGERQLFVEQFEKDVRFFQLFFLLIKRSCPIKNVDLVWVEHGPSGRAGLRHLGITEALASPNSSLLGLRQGNPHPNFCNLINGYGRHEAETCGRSDKAAEESIRDTGKTQVYRCHFGLVDIAVPVIVGGQHIATLFTGQVLREPPSQEGFQRIARDVAGLPHIDLKQLERAYWEVPVVSEDDIRNTTEILEGFAEYMANAWQRMAETVKERRRQDRELAISRKEFAHYALESSPAATASPEEMRELARKIGFTQPPNRVLVLRLESEEDGPAAGGSLDLSLASALQAIEDLCDKLDNVVAVHLWKTGICVFLRDAGSPRAHSAEFHAHRVATQILHAIRERCDLRVRVGIGGVGKNWGDLAQSYREACTALAGSPAAVATYVRPTGSFKELSRLSEQICRLVKERRLDEARSAIVSLPMQMSRRLGSRADDLVAARTFLSAALEALDFTVRGLGCDRAAVAGLCGQAQEEFRRASNVLQLHEIWVHSGSGLLDEVRRLFSGKPKKLVYRASQMMERLLERGATPRQLSIREIAAALGISTSHLSRLFKRETGQTYEHYLMGRRVELARRLLLDPLQNVSQTAQRCGFTDPSYFARVFRKVAGCSPSEYCRSPLRHSGPPEPLGEYGTECRA